jgi:DNA-binding NarL/FixJ family response regulator
MKNSITDIIIIEDNAVFRDTLQSVIMKSAGMTCNYSFPSGETAIREIELKELVPDIILLDIGLPGKDGISIIPELRRLTPTSKIIIITVYDDDENVFNAICAGASGYLLKDQSPEDIIDSIDEVLNGGASVNPHIAKRVLNMFRDQKKSDSDYGLSEREKEILKLLVEGLSKRQISEKIFLSHHTIDSHIRNIYAKLEVHSRGSAISKAIRERLI